MMLNFIVTWALLTSGSPFEHSDRCIACHNGSLSPDGSDASSGSSWRGSMMANAARDPYWQASVRREIQEHPAAAAAIEDKCATCHMGMAHTLAHRAGKRGGIFEHLPIGEAVAPNTRLAADGVSCTLCHQMTDENQGQDESFSGKFSIVSAEPTDQPPVFGPFEIDPGRQRVMQSATGVRPTHGPHIQAAVLCASCHTLFTHALNDDGEVVGELPEQVPFLEWRHSQYRDEQPCQGCHMPEFDRATGVSTVLPRARQNVSRHVFRGGNILIPRMLNLYRAQLGVTALGSELDATAMRSAQHLESNAARLELTDVSFSFGVLDFTAVIENLAGHKLPTAYPSRRVWLHTVVKTRDDTVLFESGALASDGQIEGNDNDRDAAAYETHHTKITDAQQVQIYEAVLVDSNDAVTTGLLKGVRFIKDSRILPLGFDKETAPDSIAVRGKAREDENFEAARDSTHYSIAIPSDVTGLLFVEVELLYQPIGFRWAKNVMRTGAPETERFATMYESMADDSSATLAATKVVVPPSHGPDT